MSEKKIPDWFTAWKEAGFIRHETAKKWLISGFKPEDAAPWYDLDEVEVHIASDWVKHGFTPVDYKNWSRRGFTSSKSASMWRKYFSNPDDAHRWRLAGLRVDGDYGELLRDGHPPEIVIYGALVPSVVSIDELTFWLSEMAEEKPRDTNQIREWILSGLSPSEVKHWRSQNADLQLIGKFKELSWSANEIELLMEEWGDDARKILSVATNPVPRISLGWSSQGIGRYLALEWIRIGADPVIARNWTDAGVYLPTDAQWWSSQDCDEVDALLLREDGWIFPRRFSKKEMPSWSPKDILRFHEHGIFRKTILLWLSHNRMGYQRWANFLEVTVRTEAVPRWKATRIPIEDWPRWIQLVSPLPEICEKWVTTGLSPEELTEKFRQAKCRPDEFDRHIEGERLLRALNSRIELKESDANQIKQKSQPKPLTNPKITYNTTYENLEFVNVRLSQSVIDEFQAKALYLASKIRKCPVAGKEFVDTAKGIMIRIESVSDSVIVEVVIRGKAFTIEFDSENFDPVMHLNSHLKKVAYVLALSWFVDCAITLKSKSLPVGANFQRRSMDTHSSSRRAISYVPTIQFSQSINLVHAGNGVSPVLHEVSGHIRQLPVGFSPSDHAVGRAPLFLRKKMGSQDTYVVGHTRGIEKEIDEFVVRLSKYSMTAHAFAAMLDA